MSNIPVTFCISDLTTIKQASLFYDNIVPFPFESMPMSESEIRSSAQVTQEIFEHIPSNIFNSLLGPVAVIALKPEEFGIVGHKFRASFLIELILFQVFGTRILRNGDFRGSDQGKRLSWLKEYGLEPILMLPTDKLNKNDAVADDITVTLSNLPLIDTSNAEWNQIMEFRDDEDSKKKLRNLMLFVGDEYTGKSRQYIEDNLGKRLDDYHNAVKDHGFETKVSSLRMVADSKSLIAFGTTGLASVLMGEPLLASAALATGVSLEVAKLSLNIAQKRHAFSKLRRDNDISYLIDIADKFSDG